MTDRTKLSDAGESSPEVEHESTPGRADARLDRINRYADAALNKSDDLEANLGLITADLLGMAFRQQQMLANTSERGAGSPHQQELMRTAFDDYLRVTKQIERFMQLEVRASEAHKGS
jgi:hypothetical protein